MATWLRAEMVTHVSVYQGLSFSIGFVCLYCVGVEMCRAAPSLGRHRTLVLNRPGPVRVVVHLVRRFEICLRFA
eukprot:5844470-Lingulodinium_polyedra.AAC.1